MNRRYINLIIIVVLLIFSLWAVLPNQGLEIGTFKRTMKTVQGLDLRGGLQGLLEVDLPADRPVTSQNMEDARLILENRVNGLGLSEAVVQIAGDRRMVVEIPGETNPEAVIGVIKETGLLEFVDMGDTRVEAGTIITTSLGGKQSSPSSTPTKAATVAPTLAPTAASGATSTPAATPTATPAVTVYPTLVTGDQLNAVSVSTDELGKYQINFELKTDGATKFAEYTRNNVGKILAIVLDKRVISAPSIQSAIPDGKGRITGQFTYDEANNLAIQMRYGSLPVPFKVVESRIIGPTLGEDSLNKSLLAGVIGFAIVTLFMLIYYRLPGLLAILSITTYGLITLALFNLIPVTLTLPGIAGVLLSTGGALDANILMFERMKEELRAGRTLVQAVDLGWKRAWSSIRDSNIATLITSAILLWFGSTYGATIVKGFAITLALGVAVSLFCAIMVTRTLLQIAADLLKPNISKSKWFGL